MGRSPCCEKAHTNKGAWSKQEDETLIAYIQAHGEGCWRTLPKAAGLQRCGKSCRLRWINYLRPDLKRGNFTPEEDELIVKLHSILGNKWSLIAGKLPGRTDNEIKNYWNTHIKKKLLEKGMDPYTHFPIVTSASNSGSSSNDNSSCHFNKPSRSAMADTFTDFFQQQTTTSSIISSYPTAVADDDNLNLELSITLPSLNITQDGANATSASSFTCNSCNDEVFSNGGETSSNGNYTRQESVCCHIGLHTIGGGCCCCSG